MAGPLLDTKLHLPRRRRGATTRPRLTELLTGADESVLTLVSAPAGFGKTTLLTEWLDAGPGDQRLVAWLSLDQRDNDPVVFWTYVVAALQRAVPGIGAGASDLLQSPRPSMEAALATLLQDVGGVPADVVLVLDDYHVIEAREVHEGVAFLLEHLPLRMRVVIASRADPALPLARMRARGELVELRAADLRFTTAEAAAYLTDTMGLALTAADVGALAGRTEGWIAALQLAALSLQGRADPTAFIAGFAGDDRYIVDYLLDEVLQHQSAQVRTFLLQTSVLGRLTGPLCDAVTGQVGGRAVLETLDRENVFLVPLDDRRQWYRYHHLFGDVLQARLLDEHPGRAPELHRRASDWFERNGERPEAIDHALAAGDVERAADLVELAIPVLRQNRQEATLSRWLEALPSELFARRPVLGVGYVGSLMVRGEISGVEACLRDAERWLEPGAPAGPDGPIVADVEQFHRLPGLIAIYRAGHAHVLGNVAGTMAHARRALDLVDDDDRFERGAAASLLGLAYWTTGDLGAAHRWYAQGMADLERAGLLADVVGGAVTLADIRIAQGRLGEAMGIYRGGLDRAERATPVLRGAADMHTGLADLLRERGDLEAARAHLRTSRALGEQAGMPQNPHRWRLATARLRQAEGDLAGALDSLDEAERLYTSDFSPEVRPIPAVRARLWIAQGDWQKALGWTAERGLSVDDELGYLHEFEHVTLARVLLARGTAERDEHVLGAATGLLGRLLPAAEDGGRTGAVIEVLTLQALAAQSQGDPPAALAALHRAVTLAAPEGYVRLFADEGAPMATLLRALAKQADASGRVRRLVAAVAATGDGPPVPQDLVEPLSERELVVLRLLGTDLDGPGIARELVVSLNTVRTHTSHIYAKLGVSSRRAAVRRAAELDLVAPPRARTVVPARPGPATSGSPDARHR